MASLSMTFIELVYNSLTPKMTVPVTPDLLANNRPKIAIFASCLNAFRDNCFVSFSFHLFADNIIIYKADTVISRLQVTTGQ